jgi:hypothetical protein
MASAKAVPVPKHLWDQLEIVFSIKARELIKDIAKTLHQDEKKLLQEYKKQKVPMYLVELSEPTDEQFLCQALVETTAVAHRCRRPVLYGSRCCPEHELWQLPAHLATKPVLQRFDTEKGPVFLDEFTQQMYSLQHQRIGYKQGSRVYLFEVEPEEN